MSKTAIIIGATGLTGGLLLNKLIADDRYDTIKLFTRSSVNNNSKKIKEFIIDLLELQNHKNDFTADEVFCCIGTTKAKTEDQSVYKTIDYGIPLKAARLAKENKIQQFLVISSMGADASSTIFYNRTKGEMERDVLELNIKNTYILRPSLIGGKRHEFRMGERIAKGLMSFLSPLFLGALKKYKIISPENIVACMQNLVKNEVQQTLFNSDKIVTIANLKR